MYAKNSICGRMFLGKDIVFLIWLYSKLQNLFVFVRTNPDAGWQIHLYVSLAQNETSPYHHLACISKQNSLALTILTAIFPMAK